MRREATDHPCLLDVPVLGSVALHTYCRVRPRNAGGPGPVPGGPGPREILDRGRQKEARLPADAAVLRDLREEA
ncbi:hypothetical protein AB0C52_33215 [Streptomyces sp. NPDC048717]|uniref:hypothetical protein n=1 Tax=Streptomyces sp. NPDC048717 TaxID=3154928 RepID=UPI00343022E4